AAHGRLPASRRGVRDHPMTWQQPLPRLRPVVVVPALLVALALQTTWLQRIAVAGVAPDLVLVVALCAGLLDGPGSGAVYGALGGLMQAYAQGLHLGSLGVTRALAAFLAGMVETRLLRDSVIVPMGTVLCCSLVAHAFYFVMAPELPVARPLRIALVETGLNVLLAPFAYAFLTRWGRAYR
ncbi:MAG: LytS/YhcK type 5TM receptor domain-containing protein, partial [Armatimonadota bacterium]|nr:LytS/YhcK type 5TM receptor domain-containing protein [Armatimonadota bacterium]